MKVKADFHIHSCLSACGELEMSPRALVERAKAVGLNMIALTDHNTARHCAVFEKLARAAGLMPVLGIEVTTIEEVHVLCLFDQLAAVEQLGEEVYARLPNIHNDPKRFGDQLCVNENDEIIGGVVKYLGLATTFSLEALTARVTALGGITIPAHINRQLYGLSKQLGFVPKNAGFAAVEVHRFVYFRNEQLPDTAGYPVMSNSDSHELSGLGTIYNEFEITEPTIRAIAEGLKHNRVVVG